MSRVEQLSDDVTLYLGDAAEIVPSLSGIDAVVSDPPYPNKAGHFLESIKVAEEICRTFDCKKWLVFWTETETPPVPLPLVAVHVWHRSNTNRPDNYEPIFVFSADGEKRASRVMAYPVVFPGMTGCWEATGHPTQKHSGLMAELIKRHTAPGDVILDPFMGSGTTGVACAKLARGFIGVEIDPSHFDDACKRISDVLKQPDMFIAPAPKPKQEAMEL